MRTSPSRRERPYVLLAMLVAGALVARPSAADPILDITGVSNSGYVIDGDNAVAGAFELTQAMTGVSITADLTCVSCDGGVFLTRAIGPTASIGDIVAAVNFGPGSSTQLFSALDLIAGTYFLVAGNDSGLLIWNGSTAPSVTTATGVVHHVDFVADPRDSLPHQSDFEVVFGLSAFYSIDADIDDQPAPVPEPATLLLFGSGALGVLAMRRRRRS